MTISHAPSINGSGSSKRCDAAESGIVEG